MQTHSKLPATQNRAEFHDCWQRLVRWSPDDQESASPFAMRLAKEEGWSLAFARRAIEEYKRFVFLSVVAGHVVCPSEEVDQVWHMHLTFTMSYWSDLCDQVLQQPLHHHPSKGGRAEHDKHVALYEQTLASYRFWFGEEPPEEIWPTPARRFEDDDARRVSLRRYWLLKKPAPRLLAVVSEKLQQAGQIAARHLWFPGRRMRWAGALAILPLAATGNPLNWSGVEFLGLYAAVLAGVISLGSMIRYAWWPEDEEPTENLTPEEVACLQGNDKLAIHTALARLMTTNVIQCIPFGSEEHFRISGPLPEQPSQLESALISKISNSQDVTLADLHATGSPVTQSLESALRDRGWLTTEDYASTARFVPFVMTAGVAIVGAAKVAVGLSREKPVGFLTVAVVVTFVIALMFLKRPRVTHAVHRWLKEQRATHSPLKDVRSMSNPTSQDVALATALFGSLALTGTVCEPLQAAWLRNRKTAGSSGCGTSGCGASGCGGGGCGGGSGCGGCGGGGGD